LNNVLFLKKTSRFIGDLVFIKKAIFEIGIALGMAGLKSGYIQISIAGIDSC